MRTLNSAETQYISGAYLYMDGYTISVPSTGIPSSYFNTIEIVYQGMINGTLTDAQLYSAMASVPSKYWDMYNYNIDNATISGKLY